MQTEGRALQPLVDHLPVLAWWTIMGLRVLINTKTLAYLLPATMVPLVTHSLAELSVAIALRAGLTRRVTRFNATMHTARTMATAL